MNADYNKLCAQLLSLLDDGPTPGWYKVEGEGCIYEGEWTAGMAPGHLPLPDWDLMEQRIAIAVCENTGNIMSVDHWATLDDGQRIAWLKKTLAALAAPAQPQPATSNNIDLTDYMEEGQLLTVEYITARYPISASMLSRKFSANRTKHGRGYIYRRDELHKYLNEMGGDDRR